MAQIPRRFIDGQLLESLLLGLNSHKTIWQVLPLHIIDCYKRSSSSSATPSSLQLTYQQVRTWGLLHAMHLLHVLDMHHS